MEAVANPSRTQDLFFVADGTGGHAFADTLEQHQKNVQRWRQIEKDAKDKLAPDATPPTPAPTPRPQVHGALDPVNPEDVRRARAGRRGGETGADVGRSDEAAGARSAPIVRCARLCSGRAARFRPAPTRARRISPTWAPSCEGVNDQPASTPTRGDDSAAATSGPLQTYPLSAAALADQQSRAARYGARGSPSAPEQRRQNRGQRRHRAAERAAPRRGRGRAPLTPPKARRSILCSIRPMI